MESYKKSRVVGIIPARYASTRFPGKPLALIGGKPMVQLVYENASSVIDNLYVATDDNRIVDAVTSFGGNVIITSPDHRSGTDRSAEAALRISELLGVMPEVIINIQGDEPFLKAVQITSLLSCFEDPQVNIATLIKKIDSDESLSNPNKPKVVLDNRMNALYFSRAPIPFLRDYPFDKWRMNHQYYNHIGVYGYRFHTLQEISKLSPTHLEIAESLEQVRWLENGFTIRTALTDWESIGIDTPEDLKKAERILGIRK